MLYYLFIADVFVFRMLDYARSAFFVGDIASVSRTWIWDLCAGSGAGAQELLVIDCAQDLDRFPYYI